MRRLLLFGLVCALCCLGFAAAGAPGDIISLDGIQYVIAEDYEGTCAKFAGFEPGIQSVIVHERVGGYPAWYYPADDDEVDTNIREISFGPEIRDLNQAVGFYSLLYRCHGLRTIRFHAHLTSVGTYIYGSRFMTAYEVDPANPAFKAVDGVLFTRDGKTLMRYPGGREGAYDIPEGTTRLDGGVFSGAERLTRLTVPEGVNSLEDAGLSDAVALEEIVLPASLKEIGSRGLPYQGVLQTIEVSKGNPRYQSIDGVVYSRDGKKLEHFPCGRGGGFNIPDGVTGIAEYAFNGNEGLTSLTVPEGVTVLLSGTFSGMTTLVTLALPASVWKIEDWALPTEESFLEVTVAEGSKRFKSVDGVLFTRDAKTLLCYYPSGRAGAYAVPEGTSAIEGSAFAWARGLTSVTIPEGVTALTDAQFSNAENLREAYLPASLTEIGTNALPGYAVLARVEVNPANPRYNSIDGVLFGGTKLILYPPAHGLSYDVPPGTTSIVDYAFEGREMLQTVSIPRSVTELSEGMFNGCTSLSRVSLPITLTKIGSRAFGDCISLSAITLPPGLAEIGDRAFYNCPTLADAVIPDSVTKMGSNVFDTHAPGFALYAKEKSAGYWHAWEYELSWAERPGMPVKAPDPAARATQSAVVSNASNSEHLSLYASPSAKAKSLGKYQNGTTLQVLDTKEGWAHVRLDGREGYMALDSLTFTDKLTGIVRPTWGRKRQGSREALRLYEAPSENADFVRISEDVSMRILDTQGVWYRVLLNGHEGYVPVQNLDVAYSREPEFDETGMISYYVVVNPDSHDRLNLRAEPSAKSRSLGRYFNGTQVKSLEEYGEEENGWVRVSVDGLEGYMMAQYLVCIYSGGESALWGHG